MTAAQNAPAVDQDDTDRIVGASVNALLAGRNLSRATLAEHLGIGRTSLFRKTNGASPWKAAEVVIAARYLGVEPGELLTGLGGHFNGMYEHDEAPRSTRPRGSDTGCAIRDSNPGPADSESQARRGDLIPVDFAAGRRAVA